MAEQEHTHVVVRHGRTFQVAVPEATQRQGEKAVESYLDDEVARQLAQAPAHVEPLPDEEA